MKVVDGESKVGRKLEEWFPPDKKELKLEKKITQWFIASEEDDRPLIIEERLGKHHNRILVLTCLRAILFEAGCFGRLKDVSDKVWRQFVAVHLTEEHLFSSLELHFLQCHDSVAYHNPFKENSSLKKDEFVTWKLKRLDKQKARMGYTYLKDKELYWKEKRRKEHIENQKMLMARPPGGAPPRKKPDTKDK